MTKTTDTLELYLKFMSGERLSKAQIGDIIGKKSDRTVQRYIAHLNDFFANRTDMAHLKITMNTTVNMKWSTIVVKPLIKHRC